MPYLELCHNGSVAHVYLHGGHVLHYQPAGEKPVLWHSRKSAFEDGKPIRGGVPVCWPWFCAHPSDSSQPLTEALHTYFSVGDISNVSISGLENVQYNDKVADGVVMTQIEVLAQSAGDRC